MINLPIDLDWLLRLLKREFRAANFETAELVLALLNEIIYFKHQELVEQLSNFDLIPILFEVWSLPYTSV